MQHEKIDDPDIPKAQPVAKSWRKELQEWAMAVIYCCLMCVAAPALAQSAMGAGDELGDGICKVVNILTGKWLFGGAVLATIGGLVGIIFGGEISDGIKKVATIVTILGLCVGIPGILAFAFKKFAGQTC